MNALTRAAFLSIVLVLCAATVAEAQPGRDTTLTATDMTSVTIVRDVFGVPHITGSTEVGLFYGQGYAAAEDRLFQMETFRRITLGRQAEILGSGFLANDQATITLIYTDAERTAQFNALSAGMRAILTAYKDGVNAYLANVVAEPATFKPIEFETLNIPVVDYTEGDLIAIIQGFLRGFGGNGGDELTRLAELTALGQPAFDAMYPINDPTAPTTIPTGTSAPQKNWTYSGISVSQEAALSVADLQDRALKGMPKFGSFATIIGATKSASGNVMLLGAPQMGPPVESEPSRTMEVELISPTIHVGGMTVAGAPGVIIGHNDSFAWTLTSGQSDNTDLFVESTNVAGTQYLFNGDAETDFEMFVNNIPVLGEADNVFTHFRTVHGPVVGADVPAQQAFSVQTTYEGLEMDMMQGLHDIWKASTLAGFEAGLEQFPMSFNAFFAGEDTGPGTQSIKFWHAGRYQDRTDGVDPRLPHSGVGTEEWLGFIPFASLPQATGLVQDYFVNWNNKPIATWDQGDNMPWVVGNDFRDRVNNIDAFVGPLSPFSYADLKNISTTIADRGTYTQAIEIASPASAASKAALLASFTDENLNPPGQSGFINIAQDSSAHFSDQWTLHEAFSLKDMLYSPESLPVELVGFRGLVDGATVSLVWTSLSETNAAGFEVQQAADATITSSTTWSTLGFVAAKGVESGATDYAFLVSDLPFGRHVFRLRQVDLDGSSTYSPSISVLVGTVGSFELTNVFPNPADNSAELSIALAEAATVTIDVFDILGRQVSRIHDGILPAENTRFVIDTGGLPSGIYSIALKSQSFEASRTLAVVH